MQNIANKDPSCFQNCVVLLKINGMFWLCIWQNICIKIFFDISEGVLWISAFHSEQLNSITEASTNEVYGFPKLHKRHRFSVVFYVFCLCRILGPLSCEKHFQFYKDPFAEFVKWSCWFDQNRNHFLAKREAGKGIWCRAQWPRFCGCSRQIS